VDLDFLAFLDSGFRRFVIPLTADSPSEEAVSQPLDDRQDDLFGPSLETIVNLRHPLVGLAAEIDWSFLAGRFGSVCRVGCACRKSNPDILVVQSTQDRTAKNVSSALNGARCRRILVQP
jgi:hypothetical protein